MYFLKLLHSKYRCCLDSINNSKFISGYCLTAHTTYFMPYCLLSDCFMWDYLILKLLNFVIYDEQLWSQAIPLYMMNSYDPKPFLYIWWTAMIPSHTAIYDEQLWSQAIPLYMMNSYDTKPYLYIWWKGMIPSHTSITTQFIKCFAFSFYVWYFY
jgi:hypothetical protein